MLWKLYLRGWTVFSLLLWNPVKLCVLSFIIFNPFDTKFTCWLENVFPGCFSSSGQTLKGEEEACEAGFWKREKKSRYSICTVCIIGHFQKCKATLYVGNSHEYMEVRAVVIAARRILSVSLCGMSVKSRLVFQHLWKTRSTFARLSAATSDQGRK